METIPNEHFNYTSVALHRPPSLKILCTLSFVCCGLMLIIFAFGACSLFLSNDLLLNMWDKVLLSQPQLKNIEALDFFHRFGWACIYNFAGNIVSLIGVILMWQLKKAGFFIYAIAELGIHFFGLNINTGTNDPSHASLIFMVAIDLIFIALYARNLKYMAGAKANENLSV